MKHLFLILLLISFSKSNSQETTYQNFTIKDRNIIWQKVYQNPTNINVFEYFKNSGTIKDLTTTNNTINGELNDIKLNYKGYGKSEWSTPIYISRQNLYAFITIENKKDRYRVTLKQLKMKATYSDGLSELGETHYLSDYILKTTSYKFKNSFKKSPAEIFNYTFDNLFTVKETPVETSDF